jgi:hypothetical protein
LTHDTRSAHKVGFIREKGKSSPREDREPRKLVAPCHFQSSVGEGVFGSFCWGGQSGVRDGVVF